MKEARQEVCTVIFCLLCQRLEVLEGQAGEGKDVGVGAEGLEKREDMRVIVA